MDLPLGAGGGQGPPSAELLGQAEGGEEVHHLLRRCTVLACLSLPLYGSEMAPDMLEGCVSMGGDGVQS